MNCGWLEIVEFLQQNWALVDEDTSSTVCTVFFFGDTSGVFDRLRFPPLAEAEVALLRNGFRRYDADEHGSARGYRSCSADVIPGQGDDKLQ